MSLKSVEDEDTGSKKKGRKRKSLLLEEINDPADDLPTNIHSKVNEKHKRAKIHPTEDIDIAELNTEGDGNASATKREIKFAQPNYDMYKDSDEEVPIGNLLNPKRGDKKKREMKHQSKKSQEYVEGVDDDRVSAFAAKSAFRGNKQTTSTNSKLSKPSKFQKDPMLVNKSKKESKSDYLSETMKQKLKSSEQK